MWYKYMYILYCITMYYIWYHVFPLAFLPPSGDGPKYLWYATRTSQENPWIRWCLCGHKFCHVPPRKGVPITILSMIFQLISFFGEMGFQATPKKPLPNSSALWGKASAARLELFSGCLFHRQRWGCVNGCILYVSIYEYVYICVCVDIMWSI